MTAETIPEKRCTRCQAVQPASRFYALLSNRDGLDGYCKGCRSQDKKDRVKRLIRSVPVSKVCGKCGERKPAADFYSARTCTDGLRNDCKRCQAKGFADWNRKRLYGLEAHQYARMVAEQGGHCGLCGGDPVGKGLAVDHDHRTGAVRALLCSHCNAGLGGFRDDPELLKLAISYLERHAQ